MYSTVMRTWKEMFLYTSYLPKNTIFMKTDLPFCTQSTTFAIVLYAIIIAEIVITSSPASS